MVPISNQAALSSFSRKGCALTGGIPRGFHPLREGRYMGWGVRESQGELGGVILINKLKGIIISFLSFKCSSLELELLVQNHHHVLLIKRIGVQFLALMWQTETIRNIRFRVYDCSDLQEHLCSCNHTYMQTHESMQITNTNINF